MPEKSARMTRLTALMVRSGMMRRQVMWASEPLTLAALVAVLGAGCASKSDVLTQDLGSATNPWTTCGVPDLAPFMQQSKLGDACTFVGGCGLAVDSYHCLVENRSCQHGVLFALTTEALDCPAPAAVDAGSVPAYTDCAAALGSARTGATCAWQGVCAKPSPDECCIELAACGDVSIPNLAGRVLRGHVCAPGCANLTPVAGLPAATGCPTGDMTDPGLGRPCEGNFVCVNGTEGLGGIGTAQSTSDLTWCDHGVVVGGTTFLWLP
jgi:hypothetical protein